MTDFKGRKRRKSHVQDMGMFFGGSEHGPESSCQISAHYKFFPGFNVFCIFTELIALYSLKVVAILLENTRKQL